MKRLIRKPKILLFTLEGYEKVKNEREQLFMRRKDAVAVLKQARELGDLSENGMYKAARSNLSSIDGRLRRLDEMIKFGQVPGVKRGVIGVGSKVILQSGDKKISFEIVGDFEADPVNKKISINSPIGRALLGKKEGDFVSVQAPAGEIEYQIIKIEEL